MQKCKCGSDKETRAEISRPRYGSPYPWPLNHILAFRKQFDVKNHLKAVNSEALQENVWPLKL